MIDRKLVLHFDLERSVDPVIIYESPHRLHNTSAAVHPRFPHVFLIADNSGDVKLIDERQQSEYMTPSIVFRTDQFSKRRLGLTRAVTSIAMNDHDFVVRNFGSLQLFDIRHPGTPKDQIEVQWYPGRMNWLREGGFLDDKFAVSYSKANRIVTGMYGNDIIAWNPIGKKL